MSHPYQDTLCQSLVTKARAAYGAVYARGLSNHLPMNLFSLYRLGASDEAIQSFHDDYVGRLQPRQSAGRAGATVTAATIKDWLGRREGNEELFQFFRAELSSRGRAGFLAHYLPEFMPGVAAAAFHPLIRLGFALEMDDDDEIAESFAAWSLPYTQLPEPQAVRSAPFADAVAAAAAISIPKKEIAAPGIVSRAAKAATHPTFQAQIAVPGELSLRGIAQTVLRIYLAKPTFAHLHLVTSCHALRVVAEHYPRPAEEPRPIPSEWLRPYWFAMWAVYVSEGGTGIADITAPLPESVPNWPDLAARACAAADDHTNKFVYSCQQEAIAYGDDAYRLAAQLKLGGDKG